MKKTHKFNIFGFVVVILGIGLLSLFIIIKSFSVPFCANSESCIEDLSGIYDSDVTKAEFMGQAVAVPPILANNETSEKVLAGTSGSNKRIDVDLTNQSLSAYQNDQLVMSFPVSSGKWSYTPTGTYSIWIKLRYTRMKGGKPGTKTYYNLPNVPYTMYFYNEQHPKIQGYGLHGAYWHNNFGHPMSHGCVNISPENAGKLYAWAEPVSEKNTTYATEENPGTVITIFGTTPKE